MRVQVETAGAAALAIAAFACTWLAPAGAGAAIPRPENPPLFGYNDNWSDHLGRIDFTADGGADTTRAVMSWAHVERSPGEFRWRGYDRLYRKMLASRTKPLWVLADAPCWAQSVPPEVCDARGHIAFPPSDEHFPSIAGFAARVANRYPKAVAIETWNEPNLEKYWQPDPEPERAALLSAWINYGVDVVDPEMPVVFGALLPTTVNMPGNQIKYKEFIRRAYATVGVGHWDGVSIHPFPSFQQSTHYLREIKAHLRRVRSALRLSGARGTPIWVTEIGLSTEGLRPYTKEQQARGLVRIYRGLGNMPDVPAVIIHRLIDQEADHEQTAETGWGVVRRNGRPKPAYCALARERGHGRGCGR